MAGSGVQAQLQATGRSKPREITNFKCGLAEDVFTKLGARLYFIGLAIIPCNYLLFLGFFYNMLTKIL